MKRRLIITMEYEEDDIRGPQPDTDDPWCFIQDKLDIQRQIAEALEIAVGVGVSVQFKWKIRGVCGGSGKVDA